MLHKTMMCQKMELEQKAKAETLKDQIIKQLQEELKAKKGE